MAQNIGEGTLDIPGTWTNSTVNIFTAEPPGQPGASVTINRDRLPSGMEFTAYVEKEIHKLRGRLKGFLMVQELDVVVDGRAARLHEFTWQGNEGRTMHQILVAVNEQSNLLNLVASHQNVMDDPLRRNMREILMSFRFNAPNRE